MPSVNVYLTFDGNCEQAFNHYKSILKGDFETLSKFGEMPENPEHSLSEAEKEKIMHVSLRISKETYLMGSDTGGEWSANLKSGNNFSISVNADSKDDADRIFKGLAEGGQITMPMETTFWNSYFGMCTDKFGIQWMVSYDAPDRDKHIG